MLGGLDMHKNQYKNVISNNKVTISMFIFDFIVLWYYFMGGSISLRPMASIVWLCLALVGFPIFRLQRIVADSYFKLNILMIMMISFSLLYSIDQSATMKYVLSIILYFIIAYQITSNYQNVFLLCKMMRFFLIFLLLVTFIQKFSPDTYLSVFSGFLPQEYHSDILLFIQNGSCNGFYNQTSSNALSMSLGVGLSVYFFKKHINDYSKWRYIDLFLILAFFYGVILTSRRGSTIISAILLAILLYTTEGKFGIKLSIFIVAVALWISGEFKNIPFLANIFDKFNSLSMAGDISDGRAELWTRALAIIGEKPMFGYGMDSMSSGLFNLENAHNSYLQSLLEVGVIGSFFYFLPFIYGAKQTLRKYFSSAKIINSEGNALLYFGVFWQIYSFANGFFESFFSSESSVFILLVIQFMCLHIKIDGLSDFYEKGGIK